MMCKFCFFHCVVSLVAELAHLKNLKALDLSGNEFSGSEFQGKFSQTRKPPVKNDLLNSK